MGAHELTLQQARRIAVRAQLLDAVRPGDPVEVAEQLGAVKIDPTAVIAPCEHTVCWSRIGYGYEPGQLVKAVEVDRLLFEFDGAIRPVDLLPMMRPAMAEFPRRESTRQWLEANARFRDDVVARLRAEGPLPASAIPDTARVARPPDGWSGSNQVPIMLDVLSRQGVAAVTSRQGRTRIWDLAERVWPDEPPDVGAAERGLHDRRLRALGITRHHRWWSDVGDAGETALIAGLPGRWRVDPDALAVLEQPFEGRVAFLNPYDGVLFNRGRIEELFGFRYVLEQFKKPTERVYGYFAHPVLLDDRFVGLLDASVDRQRHELVVRALHELEPLTDEERGRVRDEVHELADWLGVPLSEDAAI